MVEELVEGLMHAGFCIMHKQETVRQMRDTGEAESHPLPSSHYTSHANEDIFESIYNPPLNQSQTLDQIWRGSGRRVVKRYQITDPSLTELNAV